MINRINKYARQTIHTLIVCLAVLLSSCSGRNAADAGDSVTESDSLQRRHDITAEAMQWADSVMADMTVEQMAGQLIMPAIFSDASAPTLRQLRGYAA
ncbi:MAG: hypothetical protein K2L00_09080, partial [Muribaculaceae bacterium]|nr:hypothetical protein [Muribaculaceae bacterium]